MGDFKIWFDKSSEKWLNGLPLGNGHMGAMVHGGKDGRYDLSENTCWSGSKQDKYLYDNAKESMEEARELLMNKEYEKADRLLENCIGFKTNYGTQLPLGKFLVSVDEIPLSENRELNLNAGVAKEELYFEDKIYTREAFISNPHKVMVVKVTSSNNVIEKVNVAIEGNKSNYSVKYSNDEAILEGQAFETIHSDGKTGVTYMGNVKVISDGTITSNNNGIVVENSSYVIAILGINTNMFIENQEENLKETLSKAQRFSYDELLEEHIKEHRSWMDKCNLYLGGDKDIYEKVPTNKLIEEFKASGVNNYVAPLFFQYGRYLILNSSRPDSLLPAALQGIWNDGRACTMAWTDDMHLDINTQMNYFPAQKTGLGQCCEPLHNWIIDILAPEGKKIAKDLYGKDGWTAHTVSNAYGWAAPGWGIAWGLSATCGAWITAHLWEDYLFTNDKEKLEKYFETIKGSGEFLLELLMEDKESGDLLICPSYSPENAFIHNGQYHCMCAGATFDTVVTKYIFNAIIEGAKILGQEDDELVNRIKEAIKKLPDFKIGSHGELLEWYEEVEEASIDHRHTSHLLSLYPFNIIDVETNPELAQAVNNSLTRRLGENAEDIIFANWAGALLVTYYAKLKNGENANDFLNRMMSKLSRPNLMITHIGSAGSEIDGIYELDGNTGLTAGVIEMLLQYNKSEICVLPGIPKEWSNGEFTGLVTEKGHTFDVKWENGKVTKISIESKVDDVITLNFNGTKQKVKVKVGQVTVVL